MYCSSHGALVGALWVVPADKESVKRVKSKRYADLTGVGISDMAVATVKVIVKLLW